MAYRGNVSVAVPWSLSHYIPLNGFHPLYRALFDHAPHAVSLHAWDNVKLHRRLTSDADMREVLMSKARVEKHRSEQLARKSLARAYKDYWWPPNNVLTTELIGDIEFHHTAPFPSLKRPFVFHCEMFAPVWFPFAQQGSGRIKHATEIRDHYRSIFGSPLCLGMFSHIPETLHALSQFFSDPNIDRKLFLSRIGLSANAVLYSEPPEKSSLQRPKFLFVNSAHQNPANFFRRGGHIVLRFWEEFLASGQDGFLMMRCARPSDDELVNYGVDASLVRAETGRSIVWSQDYLHNHEINALMASAHFFLLPSASLHSVSIMQAMMFGAIPVVTDTIGTSLYVTDNESGIVLQGVRGAIWHEDEITGTLVDHYTRTPHLDDSLVSQLTARILALLNNQNALTAMRKRIIVYASEKFSGQAFSDHFWGAVVDQYQQHAKSSKRRPIPRQIGLALLDCTISRDDWSRIFESPTQPMVRINTGHSIVSEFGGAFVHSFGNSGFELNDWSVLAQHYSRGAPSVTFAHTLEEVNGAFLRSVGEHRAKGNRRLIQLISRALKPFPGLHARAASVCRRTRRVIYYICSRYSNSKTVHHDIELVRQGVHGYNIVRHHERYYAILQSEGEFVPDKAEMGGYSSCFSDHSLDQVLRCIANSISSSKPLYENEEFSVQMELALEGFHGYNIVRQGSRFHAVLQSKGPFDWDKLSSTQYPFSFSGSSLDEVRQAIESDLSAEQWVPIAAQKSLDRTTSR